MLYIEWNVGYSITVNEVYEEYFQVLLYYSILASCLIADTIPIDTTSIVLFYLILYHT